MPDPAQQPGKMKRCWNALQCAVAQPVVAAIRQ